VPVNQVNTQIESAYQSYQKEAALPGFRKGKVPLSILKARYSDTIEHSVLQDIIPQAWEEARRKHHIEPIAEPVVSDVQFKPGQPLKFTASVEIRPQIQLADYSGLKADKRPVKISQDDVQRSLKVLQEQQATIAPSEEEIAETDIAIVDSWKVDQNGVPIVGQNATDIPIDMSAPNVIKEYKQALLGASLGDQRRVKVAYPADHPKEDLAGQQVSFLLKIKEIKRKNLPPLDDEFAKAMGDFPTFKALKDDIRQKLLEQEENRAQREVEEQIIDQMIEKNPFEVPESLVAGYSESMIAELHHSQKKEEDLEQIRKSYRPLAVRAIKRWFLLEEVSKKEKLQVDEKELKDRVTAMVDGRDVDPEKAYQHLAQSGQLDKLRHSMEEEKTLNFLVAKAQVKTAPAKSKQASSSKDE